MGVPWTERRPASVPPLITHTADTLTYVIDVKGLGTVIVLVEIDTTGRILPVSASLISLH